MSFITWLPTYLDNMGPFVTIKGLPILDNSDICRSIVIIAHMKNRPKIPFNYNHSTPGTTDDAVTFRPLDYVSWIGDGPSH